MPRRRTRALPSLDVDLAQFDEPWWTFTPAGAEAWCGYPVHLLHRRTLEMRAVPTDCNALSCKKCSPARVAVVRAHLGAMSRGAPCLFVARAATADVLLPRIRQRRCRARASTLAIRRRDPKDPLREPTWTWIISSHDLPGRDQPHFRRLGRRRALRLASVLLRPPWVVSVRWSKRWQLSSPRRGRGLYLRLGQGDSIRAAVRQVWDDAERLFGVRPRLEFPLPPVIDRDWYVQHLAQALGVDSLGIDLPSDGDGPGGDKGDDL